MFIFLIVLACIFPPVGIPVLIIYLIMRKKGGSHPKDGSIQVFLSKEDGLSQLFLFLSTLFLDVTLIAINRDLGDHLSAQTLILISTVIGLAIAYLFRSVLPLIINLLGISSWWVVQGIMWVHSGGIKPYSIVVGLLFIALIFYLIGYVHARNIQHKRFSVVYLVLGIMAITGYLFILSTKPGLELLSYLHEGKIIFNSWQITVSLVLLMLATIGLNTYLIIKKQLFPAEAGFVFMIALLFGISVFLPDQTIFIQKANHFGYSLNKEFSSTGIVWAIIFNLAIFFELLGLIFSGYARREEWLINLGVFFLFFLIVVKYFDWFFSFLDKSLFFIGAGLLLFGIGWFMEKGRRQIISNLKVAEKITQ